MTDEIEESNPEVETEEPSTSGSIREAVEGAWESLAEGESSDISESSTSSPSLPSSQVEAAPSEDEDLGTIPYPLTWGRDPKFQQIWPSLPRELQEKIFSREEERNRYTNQRASEFEKQKKRYEGIDRALEPAMEEFRLNGIRPEEAVATTVEMYRMARRNPQQAVAWFANELGVDIGSLLQSQPRIDPYVQQAFHQNQRLQNELQEFRQTRIQDMERSVVGELNGIFSETDGQGNLILPYAEHLLPDIEAMLPGIKAQTDNAGLSTRGLIHKAYEKAFWANPAIRDAYLRQLERSHVANGQARVRGAKTAASSVNGSPTGIGKPSLNGKSLRDIISEKYDELSNS